MLVPSGGRAAARRRARPPGCASLVSRAGQHEKDIARRGRAVRPLRSSAAIVLSKLGAAGSPAIASISARCARQRRSKAGRNCSGMMAAKGGRPKAPVQSASSGLSSASIRAGSIWPDLMPLMPANAGRVGRPVRSWRGPRLPDFDRAPICGLEIDRRRPRPPRSDHCTVQGRRIVWLNVLHRDQRRDPDRRRSVRRRLRRRLGVRNLFGLGAIGARVLEVMFFAARRRHHGAVRAQRARASSRSPSDAAQRRARRGVPRK